MSVISRFSVSANTDQINLYKGLAANGKIAEVLNLTGKQSKSNVILALADYGAKALEEQYANELYAPYYEEEGEKLRRQSQARARRLGRAKTVQEDA